MTITSHLTRILTVLTLGTLAWTATAHETIDLRPLPACQSEDSAGPCVWDATSRGDGKGLSFWVDEQQRVHYLGTGPSATAAEDTADRTWWAHAEAVEALDREAEAQANESDTFDVYGPDEVKHVGCTLTVAEPASVITCPDGFTEQS